MAPVVTLRSPARATTSAGNDDMRGPSISDTADRYLAGRLGRGEITAGSAAKVAGSVRCLVRVVGDKPLRKLGKTDVEAWMASISDRAASTRALYWSHLNVFFEWCVDEELTVRNPFRKVKPPKSPRRPPRDLSGEQVAKLLVAATRDDGVRGRLIVLLMVQQGLRCAGVSRLRCEDVDLEGRWMRVVEKGGHERALWITDETLETLTAYLAEHPCDGGPLVRAWQPHVVPHRAAFDRGLEPGTVSRWVTKWMYWSGIKKNARDGVTPHALRHTCATDMLEAGADIMQVSATLGHASVATTMIYAHVRPKALVGAMGGRRYGDALGVAASPVAPAPAAARLKPKPRPWAAGSHGIHVPFIGTGLQIVAKERG